MRKLVFIPVLLGLLVGDLSLTITDTRQTPLAFVLRGLSVFLNFPGFLLVSLYSVDAFNTPSGHALAALLTVLASWPYWRSREKAVEPIEAPRLSRRSFLGSSAVVATGVLGYGYHEREHLETTVHTLSLPGLPAELDGLKVAMMADLHCGYYNPQDYLRTAVDQSNALKPDLILLPGDFVSNSSRYFPSAAELIAMLRPGIPGGILGTLGNHDHWHGVEIARSMLPAAGLVLVENRHLVLTPQRTFEESAPRGLCLAGVSDLWTDTPDVAQALRGVPASMPRLLMSHNPDVAELQPVTERLDYMLSGHTHGGQVRLPVIGPPWVPSRFGSKYAQGWVQGPAYPVYVTRGVGTTGVPLRLGVPPEIVLFQLKSAPA